MLLPFFYLYLYALENTFFKAHAVFHSFVDGQTYITNYYGRLERTRHSHEREFAKYDSSVERENWRLLMRFMRSGVSFNALRGITLGYTRHASSAVIAVAKCERFLWKCESSRIFPLKIWQKKAVFNLLPPPDRKYSFEMANAFPPKQ